MVPARVARIACQALGAPEGRFHRPLVLIDGEHPRDEVADEKPGDKTKNDSH